MFGRLSPEPTTFKTIPTRLFGFQGKLGLDRGIRLENLTVGHFLSALDRLADPALLQFVKHLQSRAQGEVRLSLSSQVGFGIRCLLTVIRALTCVG